MPLPQIDNKHRALQEPLDLLSEKIARLRLGLAIETDIATKFKLEQQIKEAETDLEKLSREMEVLERTPVSAKPAGPATAIPIPTLLPYLSDRSPQETMLGQALNSLLEKSPRRPLICIIHGDEYECHDMYLERLLKITLPKLLHLNAEHTFFKHYAMGWPGGRVPQQNSANLLQGYLANALVGNSAASISDLVAELFRHEMPVMIHTQLLTKDWERTTPELTREFFALWNRWPDHPPDRLLLICVFLKYQRPDKQSFLQNRKMKKLNEAIQRFLAELDFSTFEQLHGVVLPELRAIPRSDVEIWVNKHAQHFCYIDELLPRIRALYERKELSTPEGDITMEKLAGELKKLLHEHRR